MSRKLPAPAEFEIHPATSDRWGDLQSLFGPRGAFAGCWCAYWRLRHREFEATGAAEHRAVLEERVRSDVPPGLVAYRGGEPVAWVSVEPRERFDAFSHARVYRPVDDTPVWTVTCFFLREDVRGQGLTTHLLEAVKHHARENGGTAVEGYPEDPDGITSSVTPGYMGLVPAFEHAGFERVAELSNGRSVYRADVGTE